MRIVVEHDGWLLLKNREGEPFFADRRGRPIADCPVATLLNLAKKAAN
jgi:hypothetical protein